MIEKDQQQPAFRKWTPAVERGIQYAIASLDFDAKYRLNAIADDVDGVPIPGLTIPDDMQAASTWLRAQLAKRGEA